MFAFEPQIIMVNRNRQLLLQIDIQGYHLAVLIFQLVWEMTSRGILCSFNKAVISFGGAWLVINR